MSTVQGKGNSTTLSSRGVWKLEDQRPQGKAVTAQPVFIFERRDQAFKRPAEGTLYEAAEPEYNALVRKRIRPSTFTVTTTDSHPQEGPVKHSEHVLRPAVLQAPEVQRCVKVSEGNSYLLSDSFSNPRISALLSVEHSFSGAISVGSVHNEAVCRQNEDKHSLKHCTADFVFGENMGERVLGIQKVNNSQSESDSYIMENPLKSTATVTTNSPKSRMDSIENTSVIESTAAFSSIPARKCLLEKIAVITGEEAELNVVKINCKLFIFNNTTQSWMERGRGTLRLNDMARSDCGTLQSRLIMRHQGSLRLILNSRLWAQMEIQKANQKNLQMTATDLEDHSIKIFLIQLLVDLNQQRATAFELSVQLPEDYDTRATLTRACVKMASAKDTGYLYAAIHHRLIALRSFLKQKDVNQGGHHSETVLKQLIYDSSDEDDEDELIQLPKNRSDQEAIVWTEHNNIIWSIVHNSKKLEAAQGTTNKRMGGEAVVHLHNGILCSFKKQ